MEHSVEKCGRVPNVLLFLGGCLASHPALVGLRTWQVIHIGHLTDLGDWSRADKVSGLLSASHIVCTIEVLVLGILILTLGLLFTIKEGQLLLELIELHTELTADRDETTEAIDVVWVFVIDFLIDFQGLIEQVHSSVAASDHELPLDLLWLDLARPLEVLDSLLEHVLLRVVHSEARDHIDLRWIVPVALLVEVDSLELILLLLVEVAHLGQDFRVTGHLSDQDVVPLEGLTTHADQLVNVSDLVQDFIAVWNDRVQLLKSLERFVVVAETLVNEA